MSTIWTKLVEYFIHFILLQDPLIWQWYCLIHPIRCAVKLQLIFYNMFIVWFSVHFSLKLHLLSRKWLKSSMSRIRYDSQNRSSFTRNLLPSNMFHIFLESLTLLRIFWILQISDEIFTPFVVFFVLVFLVFKFQVLVKVFLKDFAYLLGERIPRNTFKWLLLSLYFFLSLWNILFHWFLPFQPKFRLPPLTRKKKVLVTLL